MSLESIRWPKPGDTLFASGKEGKSFHLRSLKWRYGHHADAFRVAADLAAEAHQNDFADGHQDALVFPILYLYRHAIELRLKDIIACGLRLKLFNRSNRLMKLMNGSHEIDKLWRKAKQVIDHCWPNGDPEELKCFEAMLMELHNADPDGQTLRYSEDREGRPHEYDELPEWINIAVLRDSLEAVFNLLEGCKDGIEYLIDVSRE